MQCQKKKRDGNQCRARARSGQKYCALHAEPGKAAESGGELPEKLTKADGLTDAQQAFATTNISLMAYLRLQAMSAAGGEPVKDNFASSYSFAAVGSLGARDGLEALLAVQMVGVHGLAIKFLATAALKNQTDYGVEASINRANRLLRTFAAQVEALKKYRSKGEQHCTVEHVHVHSGGQAVVGAVTATGQNRGRGIREMAINEPHAKRHGWLKNGNLPGDPSTAPRCGAKTRKGTPCKAPAMRNGRCRMRGGPALGHARANSKNGRYSAKAKLEAKLFHQLLRGCRERCRDIKASCL